MKYFLIFLLIFNFTIYAKSSDKKINEIISQMTIKEKIGQLFNIAIVGKKLKPEYKRFIKEYQIGGVTLFNYNIKSERQVRNLVAELQDISKIPMFISVDQEGGRITRYKKGSFWPPSQYFLGRLDDIEIVKKVAEYTAIDLTQAGINLNIAPVADILTNIKNKAIFDRSYGNDPKKVSKLVKAYVSSLQRNGVIAVLKHFPGQGSISQDTHKILPYSNIKKELLFKRDIKPFETVIKDNNAHVIMTSHVIYSDIDHRYPATLSKKVLKILRKDLGYNGIVFTDGLEMTAVLKTFGLEKATLLALQGEVDVVTINWDLKNVKRAVFYIEKALKEKKLTEKQIDEKLRRILKVKLDFLYGKRKLKPLNKKEIDRFLYCLYKKGVEFKNTYLKAFKNKKVYTNLRYFRNSKKIKYLKKIPDNIKGGILVLSSLNLNKSTLKNNLIIYLGPDIGISEDLKIVILNENNHYTGKLVWELIK